MDELIINKMEKEDKKFASIKERMFAYFLDSVICYFLIFIIFKSSQTLENLKIAIDEQNIENINFILTQFITYYLVIKFLYLLLFFYMYGATLGNMIVKTKIVNYEHFDKPNFFMSLNRAIVFMLCDVFLGGILFLSIFTNKTKRHLADTASKSVVIKID